MDNDLFTSIRLQNNTLRDKVFDAKRSLVNDCNRCKGSGFIGDEGKYCNCMREFIDIKSVLISGAPIEALDVREIVKDGRKMEDPHCKRVILSTNQHDIMDINRKKSLYKDIIKPYLTNINKGAFTNGDSLIIFGSNSRGKTWALYFILIWLIRQRPKNSILFMNLKELFVVINEAYYGSSATIDGAIYRKRATELLELIHEVDMLLIDEGSKLPKFSDNVSVQLEGLIKERIGNKKPIIMATNHTPEDFFRVFGPSVVSAFIKNVYALHIMEGRDLRQMAMDRGDVFNYIQG